MDYEKDVLIDINHFDLEWLRAGRVPGVRA